MALLNIGAGNKDDAFYRYKMPRLITKIEGRGNGIKTNLVNMVDVAKALGRPPSYTTKFFGCELGAQSKFDEKTGTSIVNGSHDNHKLVALLEIFIKKYVQCYGCGNPETEILISKSQMITMKCAACGFVSDVDMRDKLTTFILKNPPEQKKGGKDKKAAKKAEKEKLKDEPKKKKGQDEHHVKKKNGASDEEHSPSASQVDGNIGREDEDENGDDDDVEWLTDTSALAAQMRIKEQLTAATSEMVIQLALEEDIASAENGSNKKVAKGKKNSKKADKSVEQDISEENVKKMQELSIHDKLMKEFEACLKEGSTASELTSKLQSKDEDIQEAAMISYFAALFKGVSKGLAREVPKKKLYLANAAADAKWQALLLKAIEAFCNSSADLGKEFPLVMKLLYDEDILEEEQILSWYDNGAAAEAGPARKNVEPFIVWLRTAESESEEEEED